MPHRIPALLIGLVGIFVFFVGTGMLTGLGIDPWTGREWPAVILRLVKGSTSWCLTLAVVGIATRIGQRTTDTRSTPTRPLFWSRLAAYGREAQLPYCPAPDAHHCHRLLRRGTELARIGQVLDHIPRIADRNIAGL